MTLLPLHYWLIGAGVILAVGLFAILVAIAEHQLEAYGCSWPGLPHPQLDLFAGLDLGECPRPPLTVTVRNACGDDAERVPLAFDAPQYRRPTPEADAVYEAVLALRKRNHRVERRGRWSHLVDGAVLTHEELIRLAESEGV